MDMGDRDVIVVVVCGKAFYCVHVHSFIRDRHYMTRVSFVLFLNSPKKHPQSDCPPHPPFHVIGIDSSAAGERTNGAWPQGEREKAFLTFPFLLAHMISLMIIVCMRGGHKKETQ